MKIVSVEGYALSSPIEPVQERYFHGGTRRLHKRDVVLVVIETADGERGVATAGASSSAMREFFDDASQATFATLLNGPVADVLEGKTVSSIESLPGLLTEASLPDHLHHEAVAALEVALFDCRGRELGAPIHSLLADRSSCSSTRSMELYASAGMYMEPEGYARQAAQLESVGFAGYKYRPGIGPDDDRRTIDLLAETVEEMAIQLDGHTWWKIESGYDRETIRELTEYAAERGALWVEEPVAPDDYDGYRSLASTGVPLAGGESEPAPSGLCELVRTGAIEYCQGDVRHHGYLGCLQAIEACRTAGIAFVPHNFGTWLGLVANAHLVAGTPGSQLLEYPVFDGDPAVFDAGLDTAAGMYPFDLAFDIIEETLSIDDGTFRVPDGPGLGVTVDLDVIEEYPFQEGPWTEFSYDEQ
ncbi:mandelate racemase/muconate lactonizing enzyme family protein [Halocatena halophila]|uniref:mandelate racemase/muconate lactonizing enzyme family protein n=1 Tax=Halocatena halophila TaxID=2814576 RepID=UPI002ED16105